MHIALEIPSKFILMSDLLPAYTCARRFHLSNWFLMQQEKSEFAWGIASWILLTALPRQPTTPPHFGTTRSRHSVQEVTAQNRLSIPHRSYGLLPVIENQYLVFQL
jgi:hypothetical protein